MQLSGSYMTIGNKDKHWCNGNSWYIISFWLCNNQPVGALILISLITISTPGHRPGDYFIANEITTDKQKVAILLSACGQATIQ